MRRASAVFVLIACLVALPLAQAPSEKLDLDTIAKIREEGLKRSQVMDHIGWLSDVYGPRLTGGPGIMQASDWVLKKFAEWGLSNPHRETWPFGPGWSLVRFSAHLVEPQIEPLIGFPGSWTPSTNGTIVADVVRVSIESEADFEQLRGKLRDKIVLTQPARAVRLLEGPIVLRMTGKDLAEAATPVAPRSVTSTDHVSFDAVGLPGFRSWSIASSTTRARTTQTWTRSTASRRTTWASTPRSSPSLPTTPPCGTKGSQGRHRNR